MGINQDIARAIRRWPTLYRCRTDVLHQWFCVNGNGMDWIDGRLSSRSWSGDEPMPSVEEQIADSTDWMRKRLDEAVGDPVAAAKYRIMIKREAKRIAFNMENAEDLALVPWSMIYRPSAKDGFLPPAAIYPLCQYACMNEVPDDVDPEYLAAVREMIFVVFNSRANQPGISCYDEEHNLKVHGENIRFADQVLQDLARRFGDGGMSTSHAGWLESRKKINASISEMLRSLDQTGEKE